MVVDIVRCICQIFMECCFNKNIEFLLVDVFVYIFCSHEIAVWFLVTLNLLLFSGIYIVGYTVSSEFYIVDIFNEVFIMKNTKNLYILGVVTDTDFQ